jgi:hypothetical protein
MNLFQNDIPPEHIERVNNESYTIFQHLRTDKTKMLELFRGIRTQLPDDARKAHFDTIDIRIAWEEFDKLIYNSIFKETHGDMELLYDPMTRGRILSRVYNRWPIIYYVKLLNKLGAMDAIDLGSETIYVFKAPYKDSVNTISTPSPTLQPS